MPRFASVCALGAGVRVSATVAVWRGSSQTGVINVDDLTVS